MHRIHFFPPIVRISTHALTWSATAQNPFFPANRPDFNSRTHVECDTRTAIFAVTLPAFQLTHSRGVRRWIVIVLPTVMPISTHALTWSATFGFLFDIFRHAISTHALTWSATQKRCGRRTTCRISTHALTWSATRRKWAALFPNTFQLTHSRGVRL